MRFVLTVACLMAIAAASGCQANQATPRTTIDNSTPSGGLVPGQVAD